MGYVFARTFRKGNERSNAAEMGQAQKNDIRVKRQLENLMKGLMILAFTNKVRRAAYQEVKIAY